MKIKSNRNNHLHVNQSIKGCLGFGKQAIVALLVILGLQKGGVSEAAVYETPVLKDTQYSFPSDAIFVSTTGNDVSGNGTLTKPYRTVSKAVVNASDGKTIVIRGGTYREAVGAVRRRVTIQPYPHEKVWLKGSEVVGDWTPVGASWVANYWSTPLNDNLETPSVIRYDYPMAGEPDMVFINGVPLVQVGSLGEVSIGKFYVNNTSHKIYIGSNPAGQTVEVARYQQAMVFVSPGANYSILRGIGFLHYASPQAGTALAAVADGMLLENNTIAWSASRGLSQVGDNLRVIGNTFIYNGSQGANASKVKDLLFQGNRCAFNNQEHFASDPNQHLAGQPPRGIMVAGLKLAQTENVVIRDNVFEGNFGSGVWFDIFCKNSTIVRNLAINNESSGIFYEISEGAKIASNVLVKNGDHGIKIDSPNVKVYNNTFIRNGRNLGVYQDGRSYAPLVSNVEIVNNLYSNNNGSAGEAFLFTGSNLPGHPAAGMISKMDYNGYYRTSSSIPHYLLKWNTDGYKSILFTSLDAVRNEIGKEIHGLSVDNQSVNPFLMNEFSGDYRLKPGSIAINAGQSLPVDIASAVGVLSGVRVNMGALYWPTSSTTLPKVDQVISFASLSSKTYGSAAFQLTATASSGLPVSYSSNNPSVAVVSGSAVTIRGVGSVVITASQGGNANYNPASNVSQTLTIVKARQSINFPILPNKTYGDPDFNLTATASSGLPVTYTSSNPAVATVRGSRVTIHGAGVTVITASQAGNNNYVATNNVSRNFSVLKADQTVTLVIPAEKTYGDPSVIITAAASSGLPVNLTSSNTNVASLNGSQLTLAGAGISRISASQAGNANYKPATSVWQNITVQKKDLTISANNKTRTVGQSNPVFDATMTGYVNNESASAIGLVVDFSCSAQVNSPTGTYPIRVYRSSSSSVIKNYNLTFIDGNLVVEEVPVIVVPTNFAGTVDASLHRIDLSWVNHSVGATSLRLIRKVGVNGEWTLPYQVLSRDAASFSDTQVEPGTTYFYQIRIQRDSASGSINSDWSDVLQISVPIANPQTLGAPLQFSGAWNAITREIHLAWVNNSSGAADIRLLRKVGVDGIWALPYQVLAGDASTYSDTDVVPGMTYYYQIRARKNGSEAGDYSEWSPIIQVTVPINNPQTIGAPLQFKGAWSPTSHWIDLSWINNSSEATSFRLFRKSGENGEWQSPYVVIPSSQSFYVDTNVVSGVTYFYQLRARKGEGNDSIWSDWTGIIRIAVP